MRSSIFDFLTHIDIDIDLKDEEDQLVDLNEKIVALNEKMRKYEQKIDSIKNIDIPKLEEKLNNVGKKQQSKQTSSSSSSSSSKSIKKDKNGNTSDSDDNDNEEQEGEDNGNANGSLSEQLDYLNVQNSTIQTEIESARRKASKAKQKYHTVHNDRKKAEKEIMQLNNEIERRTKNAREIYDDQGKGTSMLGRKETSKFLRKTREMLTKKLEKEKKKQNELLAR